MKKVLLATCSIVALVFSFSASAATVVYKNGRILDTQCKQILTASGTSGSQYTGTVWWKNYDLECSNKLVAKISSWTSQRGGSDCTVSLSDSTNYTLSGRKCNSSTITRRAPRVLLYSNGSIKLNTCKIVTTNSGTSGSQYTGTVWWKEQALVCSGTNAAKISSWTSERGGSDCTISATSPATREGGGKCHNSQIYKQFLTEQPKALKAM